MPLPTSGSISFGQIRDEMHAGLGYSAYGSFPLNDGTFRAYLTDTGQNSQLSLSSIRGNAFRRFVIAADTANYNIRDAMVSTGWNGSAKAVAHVVVNGGVTVSASSTGIYAMDSGSSWPGPSSITIFNSGYILGKGGDGGPGGQGINSPRQITPGSNGGGGGPGLISRRPLTVSGGWVAGGGGGGGGGGGSRIANSPALLEGGDAGGGGASNRYPSAGGVGGTASGGQSFPGGSGQPGGWNAAGAKGTAAFTANGGDGGGWGAAGASAQPGVVTGAPPGSQGGNAGVGGGGGVSIQGWSVTSAPGVNLAGPVSG